MESPSTSSSPSAKPDAAAALILHFPPHVQQAYTRFRATRSAADADIVILALVVDHIPDKQRRTEQPPADSCKLMEDLGFDSIAITEMLFFLEDLFQVRIGNEEIIQVQTVGDLRSFVRQKLADFAPAPHA